MKKNIDILFKYIFLFFTTLSVVSLFLITLYIVVEGLRPFVSGNINFIDFITGMRWNPANGEYGVFYMILGTLSSTLVAMIFAIPLSLFTAIAISEFFHGKLATFVTGAVELLAGIPSVIFGVIGLVVVVPYIQNLSSNPNSYGNGLLATSIVLAIMTIPTIVAVSVSSIKAVPDYLKEGSYGLGASKIQTIFKVVVPTAKSGIIAGIVLGIGRAIGETIAVVMVAGNVGGGFKFAPFNEFIFQAIRPLTASIAVDISYASGVHKQALFATALVLFVFIFILNVLVQYFIRNGERHVKKS